MEKEKIKFAFSKVKKDITFLKSEISDLKQEINNLKKVIQQQNNKNISQNTYLDTSTHNSTHRHKNQTNKDTSTHNSTLPQEIEGLKTPNLGISTGNEGASTDRQTDRQTDKSPQNIPEFHYKKENNDQNIESNITEASEILDSLDKIKKEIRLKFKRLTNQEMAIFSTIYQLTEQDPENTTYKNISKYIHLSESSVRDYIHRIIKKGIPIKKNKINNKQIILSISPQLKKIATLSTILKLREL